jgi:hypothetical protein
MKLIIVLQFLALITLSAYSASQQELIHKLQTAIFKLETAPAIQIHNPLSAEQLKKTCTEWYFKTDLLGVKNRICHK